MRCGRTGRSGAEGAHGWPGERPQRAAHSEHYARPQAAQLWALLPAARLRDAAFPLAPSTKQNGAQAPPRPRSTKPSKAPAWSGPSPSRARARAHARACPPPTRPHRVELVLVFLIPQQHHVLPQLEQPLPRQVHLRGQVRRQPAARLDARQRRLAAGAGRGVRGAGPGAGCWGTGRASRRGAARPRAACSIRAPALSAPSEPAALPLVGAQPRPAPSRPARPPAWLCPLSTRPRPRPAPARRPRALTWRTAAAACTAGC